MWKQFTRIASPGGAAGKLSVLFLHRVLAEHDPLRPSEPDARQFDDMMHWLQSQFNVLPLAEAVHRLSQGSLPPAAAAITFDDGYRDNLDIAAPILERRGLPATFFIATGFLDGGIMFNDVVIESLRQYDSETLSFEPLALRDLPLQTAPQRAHAIAAVLRAAKHLPFAQRQETVAAFARHCRAVLPTNLMLDKHEVRRLSGGNFCIGAHTIHHPILTQLPVDQASVEIQQGRKQLQDLTDTPVTLFAYPNGREGQDYDLRHRDMAKACGFSAAFSTEPFVCVKDSDPWRLPRFTPWDRTRARFQARMLAHQWKRPPADHHRVARQTDGS